MKGENMDIIALILAFVVLARLGPCDPIGVERPPRTHLDLLQSPLGCI